MPKVDEDCARVARTWNSPCPGTDQAADAQAPRRPRPLPRGGGSGVLPLDAAPTRTSASRRGRAGRSAMRSIDLSGARRSSSNLLASSARPVKSAHWSADRRGEPVRQSPSPRPREQYPRRGARAKLVIIVARRPRSARSPASRASMLLVAEQQRRHSASCIFSSMAVAADRRVSNGLPERARAVAGLGPVMGQSPAPPAGGGRPRA